jgi:hypothetical protein
MEATQQHPVRFALAATLLVTAVGLWLSGANFGEASTADNTQSVSATVTNSISWGTVGACTQSTGAANFGSIPAGSSATAPSVGVYTGCITSNATWAVAGTMTTAPTSGGDTLGKSNFRAEVATVPTLADLPTCTVGNSSASCTLNNSAVPFVSNAPATPAVGTLLTNGFTYDYKLAVPSSQPSGSYTNGLITLTASN